MNLLKPIYEFHMKLIGVDEERNIEEMTRQPFLINDVFLTSPPGSTHTFRNNLSPMK
jgi:hypothetical protein